MTILVAYSHTNEGAAALAHAARLSAKDAQDLVVFDLDASSTADDGSIAPGHLPEGSVSDGHSVSWRGPDHQSQDAAGDLLDVAEQIGAEAIVVGVRRRVPGGQADPRPDGAEDHHRRQCPGDRCQGGTA